MCRCSNRSKCQCSGKRSLQFLTANLATAHLRRATYNGRTHVVVPVVMLVEGVLSGSNGPLYYPASEMRTGYRQWDGIPLMDGHPERNGTPISANHVSARGRSLGVVRNTRLDRLADGRMRWKAEAWFDEEKTRIINPEILKRIEKGIPVEISTGLFTDNEGVMGNFRGNGYSAIARNYVADHLAVLVDKVGACSLRDGCGLSVNQASNTFVLVLNKWSNEARAAALEARRQHSHGGQEQQKKPSERVRLSYDMAREYLKKKHGIDAKDKADIRKHMEGLAKKKEHHGAIRELARDHAGMKAEKQRKAAADDHARRNPVQVKGPDSKKAEPAKASESKKGDHDPAKWESPWVKREREAGRDPEYKPSQKAFAKDHADKAAAKGKAPPPDKGTIAAEVQGKKDEAKPRNKGGRPKYQDSGKREPLIPKSWKDKYKVKTKAKAKGKAKKKVTRNAWSEAARKAAIEKRRRKGIKKEYLKKNPVSTDRIASEQPYSWGIRPLNRMIAREVHPPALTMLKGLRDKIKRSMQRNGSESSLRLLSV